MQRKLYSYRDVLKPDGIPAIVPVVLFERVQERLAKNKKAPARYKAKEDGGYLLTTKLFCGKFGAFKFTNKVECILICVGLLFVICYNKWY